MPNVIVYYVHPGQRFSKANAAMWNVAAQVEGITRVDLYGEYPRFEINIDREQERLLKHDIVVFQFPMFWYSTPSLLKEWQDLVLEHGFAYGSGGDALKGKTLQLAVTAAGPTDAYSRDGYQRYHMREFLRPLEQTARLCHMTFPTPYVLFAALSHSENSQIEHHAAAYGRLLRQLRDGETVVEDGPRDAVLTHSDVPEMTEA